VDWRIAHVVRGAGVPAGAPHGWGGAAVAAGGCLRFFFLVSISAPFLHAACRTSLRSDFSLNLCCLASERHTGIRPGKILLS